MIEKTDKTDFKIANLVPEEKLIESLPPHRRIRFERALKLIHGNLSSPLNWNEVAQNCHISSHHFMHMFRLLFNETPGQYQRRMRMKQAVYYLLTESGMTVADIAVKTGFSSSQALAKALKRELGMSASDIRSHRYNMNETISNKMEVLLGHPQKDRQSTLENHLSDRLTFTLSQCPERYFHTVETDIHELNSIQQAWESIAPENSETQVILSTWQDTESYYEGQKSLVGYPCKHHQANKILPDGKFLSCQVRYADLSGYYSAWRAVQNYIDDHNLETDRQTPVLEIIHNPRTTGRSVEMTISVFIADDSQAS